MADLFAGRRPRRADRIIRRGPGFAGSIGALALFCLSLTPSLLPRHWALQGLVSGVTVAIGYGLGTCLGALLCAVRQRRTTVPRSAWFVLGGFAAVLAPLFLLLGDAWQREVRQLVGAAPATSWEPLFIAVVAAEVFVLLLLAARTVRLVVRGLTDTFGRFTPRPVAAVTAVGVVAALTYGLGPGVAFAGFVDIADRFAAEANRTVSQDLSRPSSPHVSGGPGSLVEWESLGAKGRDFIAGTVTHQQLVEFTGPDAVPPVRVYVGRDSAPTMAERAALAVRELERTGAFDREVVAVVTTTGTGWVNPVVADALELLHGGDTAVAAMQYSYLPSWISFMVDRSSATEAAAALVGAVTDRVAQLPADQRPELVVYGESLGAHGVESALGGPTELAAGTDGALLVGPPYSSPVWREVTAERDPASPIWRPAYEGGAQVRFAQDPDDLAGIESPDVIYLQNASDPIVWWSPELLYREPAWLDDRGPDVSGEMRWFPVVTFWQVTVDLVTATKAPQGHGHSYGPSLADAWAALVPPADWTDADTDRLRSMLAVTAAEVRPAPTASGP